MADSAASCTALSISVLRESAETHFIEELLFY
jgi:hypothetical protein